MRYLLMGGQACVFYGAAEFSRDLDLVVLLDDANWPMIRRVVERAFYSTAEPSASSVGFWLAGLRTPELLIETAERYPAIEDQLEAEEKAERAADMSYWEPLKAELQRLRHTLRKP